MGRHIFRQEILTPAAFSISRCPNDYWYYKRKQIEDKDYIAKLKQDGMRNFIKYGVACYKKDCKVMIYEE